MPIEPSVNWFSDYDINQPQDGDYLVEGDNHLRNLKKSILAQFPSLGDVAMNATAVELNALDLTTGFGTAEASKALVLDGSKNVGTVNQLTATTLVADAINGGAGNLAIAAPSGNVTVESLTFNGTVVTGATSITATSFVGNASTATLATTAASCSGNAATASNWSTSRTVQLIGDVTGVSSSSSGNHIITTSLAINSVNTNELVSGAVQAENATSVAGGVGTYALLWYSSAAATNSTLVSTGSNLYYTNASGGARTAVPSGQTWRCMGQNVSGTTADEVTLWLRVS